jgi:hypothetical protein
MNKAGVITGSQRPHRLPGVRKPRQQAGNQGQGAGESPPRPRIQRIRKFEIAGRFRQSLLGRAIGRVFNRIENRRTSAAAKGPPAARPATVSRVRQSVRCAVGTVSRLRSSRDLASMHPNGRGPRRLSRSKPMETTRNPGPFRLSGITAPAEFVVRDALVHLGTPEFRGQSRCRFWTRYWGYQ